MKFMYGGTLYEEDYHNKSTSHFNLDFINQIHDLATKIGLFAFRYVRSKSYRPNAIVKALTNPNVYLLVTDSMQYEGADAEVSNYKDGYLLTISAKHLSNKDISNEVFVYILHEVTHIIQRENGINPDSLNHHINGLNINAYMNDPTEINAFLMSIIAYITFSAQRARLMTKMPFNVFVRQVLSYLGVDEKSFTKHMANGREDNTFDSTRSKFYEVLGLLYSKLKQGYFSELHALKGSA